MYCDQHILDACSFVGGGGKAVFLSDRRDDQAVITRDVIAGEAASKIMDNHTGFSMWPPVVQWHATRAMRNCFAHG